MSTPTSMPPPPDAPESAVDMAPPPPAGSVPPAVPVPPDREDLRILRALRRIIRAVELHSHQLGARHGITAPQLICLRNVIEEGPLMLRTLAGNVYLTPSTVVGIVDRLCAKGLVTRTRSTRDRRQVVIETTQAGRDLALRTPLPLQTALSQALDGLPEDEGRKLAESLEQIIDLLGLQEISAAPVLGTGTHLNTNVSPPSA